ncbi:hypothetical protein DIPPA_24569 [Diplonema papillatum]|nr:hypothetical protein DIPPA_24569 [Diplonema papillatum]
MDYWKVDFKDECASRKWLEKKAPWSFNSIVGIFGVTSTGKSATINAIIGAYVRRSALQDVDRGITFVRCVPADTFTKYLSSSRAEAAQPINAPSTDSSTFHNKLVEHRNSTKRLITDPPVSNDLSPGADPRYGHLYLHSNFSGGIKTAFSNIVPESRLKPSDCLIVNYDYVREERQKQGLPPPNPALLNTVLVDSKGFEYGNEQDRETASAIMMRAEHSFCFLPSYGKHTSVMRLFETATLASKGLCINADGHIAFSKTLFQHVVSYWGDDKVRELPQMGDVWQKTSFVATGLDRSIQEEGVQKGYSLHYGAAKQILGAATCQTPDPLVVSVPTVAEARKIRSSLSEGDRATFDALNEWPKLERQMLPPQRSLCDAAGRYFEQAYRKRWKAMRWTPFWVANDDTWYVNQIERYHKCPLADEHAEMLDNNSL